jgi:hypothetical protein
MERVMVLLLAVSFSVLLYAYLNNKLDQNSKSKQLDIDLCKENIVYWNSKIDDVPAGKEYDSARDRARYNRDRWISCLVEIQKDTKQHKNSEE